MEAYQLTARESESDGFVSEVCIASQHSIPALLHHRYMRLNGCRAAIVGGWLALGRLGG